MPTRLLLVGVPYAVSIVLALIHGNTCTATIDLIFLLSLLSRQSWARTAMMFFSGASFLVVAFGAGLAIIAAHAFATADTSMGPLSASALRQAGLWLLGKTTVDGAMFWALTREEIREWASA